MAIACASRWRFRTPTGSACRTSASRRCTASSTPKTTSSANGSSCRRSRSSPSCRRRRAPLLTLESQTPVGDFDVVAFSVSFEWDYVNVLTLLRLAGIPAYAAERSPRHPLIVVGGAVTFVNPEPLAPFADVIAAGEGEVLVPGLRRAVAARDRSRRPAAAARRRARLLRSVALRAAVRATMARWPGSRCARASTRRCRCGRRR